MFVPLLNKSINEFVAAHNNHKVSTEENKTPIQMFWSNQHLVQIHTGANEMPYQRLDVNNLLGDNLPHIKFLDTEIPINGDAMAKLQNTID